MESAPVTLLLLAANVLVSGYAFFVDPSLMDRFSFRPRRVIERDEYYRLLSGGFVHAGFAHLAFNMLTLYFFGPNLEALLGPLRYLVVYFGAELAAHGATLYLHRHDPHYAAVGASGAISGVLFGFCLFYPLSKIFLFFIPIGIPAIVFAPGYVFVSIYAMREGSRQGTRGSGGGIAHEAHVGGAIGGLLLTILLEPRAIPLFLQHIGL